MTGVHRRPPRLAERIAEAVLDPSRWSETKLGDLSEDHATLLVRRGRLIADVWYWLQTVALIKTAAITFLRTGDSPMRTMISELKFAVRTVARQPLMAAAVITTMALGLGANAAAFSMLNEL